MKKILRLALAVGLAAGTCLAVVFSLPSAAGATTPPGCSTTVETYTQISVKCTDHGYHGKDFRITAQACTTANCGYFTSAWKAYGSTATLTVSTSAGFVFGTLSIAWEQSNGVACAFTQPGGSVAWCDMQASIQYWAGLDDIQYNQNAHTLNWYGDRYYRQDCSGLVSMAWHLDTSSSDNWGAWTGNLPDFGTKVSTAYGTTSAYVHPGDALNNQSEGHAVIFAGWASDHKHFSVWSFGDGTMSTGHLFTNQPYWGVPSEGGAAGWLVAGHYQSNYVPYRYSHKSGL